METLPLDHILSRAGIHALVGSAFGIGLLIFPQLVVLVSLAATTAVYLSLEVARLRVPSVNRRFLNWLACLLRREEAVRLTGGSYLLIACLITGLAFPRYIAIAAILFESLGDPAATVVGAWKGHRRLWGKSVEGHIACLVICSLIGSFLSGMLGSMLPIVAITGVVSATLFQALPIPLNDNLTIPLGSAVAMTLISLCA